MRKNESSQERIRRKRENMTDGKYESFGGTAVREMEEEEEECSLKTPSPSRVSSSSSSSPSRVSSWCPIPPKYMITAACISWGFLTGVERAIILPTLWLYFVTKFGSVSAHTYYGVSLAAFNLAVFLFAPLYGYLAYRGFKTKALLVISNQMEVIGNVVYFAASEPWLVMLGRFISGIGSGSEVPLYADVVRVTSPEERTPYIVMLLLARQVGLVIGPAATLILHPIRFQIGTISLNIYNSPGFLMAILWCLQTIQVLVTYPDISKTGELVHPPQQSKGIPEKIMDNIYDGRNDDATSSSSSSSNQSDSLGGEKAATPQAPRSSYPVRKVTTVVSKFLAYANYVTVSLLAIVFASYFCLMGLEAVVTPVTVRFFHWNEVHNSYLYLVAGILVIIIYGALHSISRLVRDRIVLLTGLLSICVSYLWIGVSLLFVDPLQPTLYICLLCVGAFFHIFGLSLVIACGESLFTKTLPPEEMDMAQSVLRTTINFSFLVGPFIAGSLQMYPYLVFLIMFLLASYSLLFLLAKFSLFDF